MEVFQRMHLAPRELETGIVKNTAMMMDMYMSVSLIAMNLGTLHRKARVSASPIVFN